MNTGQLLIIIGLFFSVFASLILAIAELKIKRDIKASIRKIASAFRSSKYTPRKKKLLNSCNFHVLCYLFGDVTSRNYKFEILTLIKNRINFLKISIT